MCMTASRANTLAFAKAKKGKTVTVFKHYRYSRETSADGVKKLVLRAPVYSYAKSGRVEGAGTIVSDRKAKSLKWRKNLLNDDFEADVLHGIHVYLNESSAHEEVRGQAKYHCAVNLTAKVSDLVGIRRGEAPLRAVFMKVNISAAEWDRLCTKFKVAKPAAKKKKASTKKTAPKKTTPKKAAPKRKAVKRKG